MPLNNIKRPLPPIPNNIKRPLPPIPNNQIKPSGNNAKSDTEGGARPKVSSQSKSISTAQSIWDKQSQARNEADTKEVVYTEVVRTKENNEYSNLNDIRGRFNNFDPRTANYDTFESIQAQARNEADTKEVVHTEVVHTKENNEYSHLNDIRGRFNNFDPRTANYDTFESIRAQARNEADTKGVVYTEVVRTKENNEYSNLNDIRAQARNEADTKEVVYTEVVHTKENNEYSNLNDIRAQARNEADTKEVVYTEVVHTKENNEYSNLNDIRAQAHDETEEEIFMNFKEVQGLLKK